MNLTTEQQNIISKITSEFEKLNKKSNNNLFFDIASLDEEYNYISEFKTNIEFVKQEIVKELDNEITRKIILLQETFPFFIIKRINNDIIICFGKSRKAIILKYRLITERIVDKYENYYDAINKFSLREVELLDRYDNRVYRTIDPTLLDFEDIFKNEFVIEYIKELYFSYKKVQE